MIPEMVHPLGKYWDQPKREHILVDEIYKRAQMDEKTFKELKNYESSNPTGAYEGKMWRSGMVLLWFEQDPNDEKYLLIKSLDITFTQPTK